MTNGIFGVIISKNNKGFDEDGLDFFLLESRWLVKTDKKASKVPITSEPKSERFLI
ncbi:MAG: hypothetical protein IJJ40_03770 [Clostridia bacterium]|nr:hypothetical protein [Clostridia bacterium]